MLATHAFIFIILIQLVISRFTVDGADFYPSQSMLLFQQLLPADVSESAIRFRYHRNGGQALFNSVIFRLYNPKVLQVYQRIGLQALSGVTALIHEQNSRDIQDLMEGSRGSLERLRRHLAKMSQTFGNVSTIHYTSVAEKRNYQNRYFCYASLQLLATRHFPGLAISSNLRRSSGFGEYLEEAIKDSINAKVEYQDLKPKDISPLSSFCQPLLEYPEPGRNVEDDADYPIDLMIRCGSLEDYSGSIIDWLRNNGECGNATCQIAVALTLNTDYEDVVASPQYNQHLVLCTHILQITH